MGQGFAELVSETGIQRIFEAKNRLRISDVS